ncbi:nucleotidyltransferase domain-containing protein [Rhizobium sp. CF122]|uniref:nucleotidyltransferase domain-containing protein n=1 Tax=Rhizobium sp. CF122 TaxID=1144312 RepID=UPI001FCB9151
MVRGDEPPDSDVDLMVVSDLDLFDIGPALDILQKAFDREIDIELHTPEEWARMAVSFRGPRKVGYRAD